jgi:hypothetical protein
VSDLNCTHCKENINRRTRIIIDFIEKLDFSDKIVVLRHPACGRRSGDRIDATTLSADQFLRLVSRTLNLFNSFRLIMDGKLRKFILIKLKNQSTNQIIDINH